MLPLLLFASMAANYGLLEDALLREVNLMRQNPRAYAQTLERFADNYRGLELAVPGQDPMMTVEGKSGAMEAVRALRAAPPLPAVRSDASLKRVALRHVEIQGPRGTTGHSTATFPPDMVRYSENISYGPRRARDIVIHLLIDDGQPRRGHRKNLLDPEVNLVGVACGNHRSYGTMCVIDFGAR